MSTIFKGYYTVNINNAAFATLYTAPALTTTSLTSVIISNKSVSAQTVSVQVVRSGGINTTNVVTSAPVPVGSAIDIIINKPIVLNAGDYIQAQASAATTMDATISCMEQS
jgi:hypothetical protein